MMTLLLLYRVGFAWHMYSSMLDILCKMNLQYISKIPVSTRTVSCVVCIE